jgi:hypothetical protein
MVNEEQLAILKKGPEAWNDWRRAHDGVGLDLSDAMLSGADLTGADLSGADLSGACLSWATLSSVNLSSANLSKAELYVAVLSGADLSGAGLNTADLTGGDFSAVNFSGADLHWANLRDADLSGANFVNALIGDTSLVDLDLSSLVNTQLTHVYPSTVDHRSIARSLHCANLLPFLVATGMPHIFATYAIDAIRSLDPNGLFNLMHSTFISYGRPDEQFATKLQEALQANGVRTFLFRKDAVPGQVISDVMRDQVRGNDRIVLICSENSLNRPGVLNEMELTLRREAREGGHTLLIPIALDDYVYEGWKPDNKSLKEAVLERVIADFVGAETDQTLFDHGIERLLAALHVSQ